MPHWALVAAPWRQRPTRERKEEKQRRKLLPLLDYLVMIWRGAEDDPRPKVHIDASVKVKPQTSCFSIFFRLVLRWLETSDQTGEKSDSLGSPIRSDLPQTVCSADIRSCLPPFFRLEWERLHGPTTISAPKKERGCHLHSFSLQLVLSVTIISASVVNWHCELWRPKCGPAFRRLTGPFVSGLSHFSHLSAANLQLPTTSNDRAEEFPASRLGAHNVPLPGVSAFQRATGGPRGGVALRFELPSLGGLWARGGGIIPNYYPSQTMIAATTPRAERYAYKCASDLSRWCREADSRFEPSWPRNRTERTETLCCVLRSPCEKTVRYCAVYSRFLLKRQVTFYH